MLTRVIKINRIYVPKVIGLHMNHSKKRKFEDDTEGIAAENIISNPKRGPRAKSGKDERKELAKTFQRVALNVGCVRTNVVRPDIQFPLLMQMREVLYVYCHD